MHRQIDRIAYTHAAFFSNEPMEELASLLPAERRASARVIEVIPQGRFVTYGVGVALTQMRNPAAARARVPVTQEGNAP